MALAGSIVESAGILLSESKTVRNLRDAGETYYNDVETIQEESRTWVALTEAAATTAVSGLEGEPFMTLSGAGVTYQNAMAEDTRVVGSYTYTCSAQKKLIEFNPPPA